MKQPTPEEKKAVIAIVLAVRDVIRDLGEVPSGHLYARLMGILPNLTLENYTRIIDTLKGAGQVTETNNLLRWAGQ